MNQRKKDFIAGAGWCLNAFLIIGLICLFSIKFQDKETGYTIAHRAELQNKFNNIVPLSIADIGEDAN